MAFLDELNGNSQTGSDGAWKHARRKVVPDIFLALNRRLLERFYREFESEGLIFRWKGHLLVAIDGSYLTIPKSKELRGWYPMPENQPCPKGFLKALASFQLDVLNGVVWTAELLPIQE